MNYYDRSQIELVEFSEKVYHLGLRHKGINGSLYEDKLILMLRKDISKFSFYKGQIKLKTGGASNQYDVIICKNNVEQPDFIADVSNTINLIDEDDCLGVIELKKWGTPKMISKWGPIHKAYLFFKEIFPKKSYFFICLRFKDRKKNKKNWSNLSKKLKTDGNFCFWGRHDKNLGENKSDWSENEELLKSNENYMREYERLVNEINKL